jgi:hypothetical protein
MKAKLVEDKKFASIAPKAKSISKKEELLSQRHVRFKPSPTMHTTAFPKFSPIGATATSGDFPPSSRSTDTPVFSFSITSGEDIFQDNIALLVTPQKHKFHAIFGSHLAPPGICGITKTQPQAKQKAAKNAKAESVEDKKNAIAAC